MVPVGGLRGPSPGVDQRLHPSWPAAGSAHPPGESGQEREGASRGGQGKPPGGVDALVNVDVEEEGECCVGDLHGFFLNESPFI